MNRSLMKLFNKVNKFYGDRLILSSKAMILNDEYEEEIRLGIFQNETDRIEHPLLRLWFGDPLDASNSLRKYLSGMLKTHTRDNILTDLENNKLCYIKRIV